MFIDRITIKYMEILNYIKGYLNTKGHILNIYDIDESISVYGIDEDEEDLFRYWSYKFL